MSNTQDFAGLNLIAWKLVLPKEIRDDALKECHDVPTASHMGIAKTINRIRDLYYWPSIKNDVVNFIRRCKTCAQVKASSSAKHGLMGQAKSVAHPLLYKICLLESLPQDKL